MRAIDADALKNRLTALVRGGTDLNYCIADMIDRAPTIEPERKKGEWIEDGYNHYKAVCSECGEPCRTYVMGKPRDRFCKWCGADMRGEPDETD